MLASRLRQAASAAWADELPEEPAGNFLIGVDSQPTTSFATWKNRGITTLVRVPSGHDEDAWTSAAQAAGLTMIRRPRAGTADNTDVPGLIAWSLGDEPDLKGTAAADVVSAGNTLRSQYPDRPVFLNYAGGAVMGHQGSTDEAYYEQASAGGDWICNDIYPVTGWNKPQWVPEVGGAVDVLRAAAPGKSQFCYIECSDQNKPTLSFRAATPAEMRCEIWCGVIAGVQGIIYFPIRLSNDTESFSFDGVVDAGLEDEMIAQNTILTGIGSVLVTERNPGSRGVSVSNAVVQAGWRIHTSGQYVITVNTSSSSAANVTITISGFAPTTTAQVYGESRSVPVSSSAIIDSFEPYGVHVYRLM